MSTVPSTPSALFPVRVARKTVETLDICTFELVDVHGGALPPFSAGAHVDVEVKSGLVRQYSLCNDPAETHRYLIGVLRDPASRGGSVAMHTLVEEGMLINISAPKNHFALAREARRSLLLAGGIGVTPILCMAERLSATGAGFDMHYCTRSKNGTAFLGRIQDSDFADRVHFHFDDGPAERKADLAALLAAPDAGTHLYVCGPGGFLDAVVTTAKKQGWAEGNIHFEYFSAKLDPNAAAGSFDVKIASSGRIVPVAADQTVLAALASAGVELPFSCEQGVCGTCLTRVIEGEPDHRDAFLTDVEKARNDQFLPCCSRARSPMLVLDL
ncbi:MAG: PDR/VanB family oxidoreductase [Methyloversatilis sp.]|uniref:PDR/VanB family oxidoreductase n=1 Tax=Methyloversatilis sp. TaxID=2569862 RepID=UPI002733AAC0|nr:PDR/VanB family oxidoreductase [Methyloversatilis sp.]MDP3874864.1 PDR/VanB family oxidoreductase [Methyloversatilis sp.]